MMKLLYLFFFILFFSCNNFIDPKSGSEYTPTDVASLNELLIGNAYLDPNNATIAVFSLNEILADDWSLADLGTVDASSKFELQKYKPIYTWHPDLFKLAAKDNVSYVNVWSDIYKKILGCNAVLDYVDQAQGSPEDREYVKGQALALRAFYFFHLVNLFGEPYNYNKKALGVPLKITSTYDLNYPKRNTVEEVYAQIDLDINEAENYFSKLPRSKQFTKQGRITLPMIQLLKARIALFKEDYDTVISYSSKVVNDWGLSLLDLNTLNLPTAPNYVYYNFPSYDNPESLWIFGNYIDFQRFVNSSVYVSSRQFSLFKASDNLLASYSADDLRRSHYIIRNRIDNSQYLPYGKARVENLISTPNGFGRSLRLSEAYLMLAEAYYFKAEQKKSIDKLKLLRSKRFKDNSNNAAYELEIAVQKNELFEFIKQERRRELCFEGLRWFDLRRFGMNSFSRNWIENGQTFKFVMQKNDPAFTLPIPDEVLLRNSNLEQNILSTPKY